MTEEVKGAASRLGRSRAPFVVTARSSSGLEKREELDVGLRLDAVRAHE